MRWQIEKLIIMFRVFQIKPKIKCVSTEDFAIIIVIILIETKFQA